MLTYNYVDVQQNFTAILHKVKEVQEVLIHDEDGLCFILKLLPQNNTDYNLPTLNLDLSREEIVELVQETRIR